MRNKNGVSIETAEAMGRAFALLCRDIDEARGIPWRAGEPKDCEAVEESNIYRGWIEELGFLCPVQVGNGLLSDGLVAAIVEWEKALEADPCYQAFRKALYDNAKTLGWEGK